MIHLSKNIFWVILVAALLVSGCNQEKELPVERTGNDSRILQADLIQVSTVETASTPAPKEKISPLEFSQKEYLDAYNDYVRLLRESGPQTIETLQALAVYQKKYQIYQMLLKAEGDKGQ